MITLEPMTSKLAHLFYKEFTYDPATFSSQLPPKPFDYSVAWVDAYCRKQTAPDRVHLAIMQNHLPIGEILFKNLDRRNHSCVFSIHLKNDAVKNQGIGKNACTQALIYAFHTLQVKQVFADALLTNTRSRHVLESVGYQEIRRDELFCYYQYCIEQFHAFSPDCHS